MKKKMNLLELSKNELKDVKAGKTTAIGVSISSNCSCGCLYAGPQEGPDDDHFGGSSTSDNRSANSKQSSSTTTVVVIIHT